MSHEFIRVTQRSLVPWQPTLGDTHVPRGLCEAEVVGFSVECGVHARPSCVVCGTQDGRAAASQVPQSGFMLRHCVAFKAEKEKLKPVETGLRS